MKTLIVEDNEVRIAMFKKWIPNADITKVPKVAIDLLKRNFYDVIFLDHDLSGVFEASGDGTGYEVAKYIADNKIKSEVIVHSFNPVGAQNMMALLSDAHWFPFGTFICECKLENGEVTNIKINSTTGS